MNHKELEKKAAQLRAGLRVEIDGLWFSAKRLGDGHDTIPCWHCNVDCLCHGDIARVCQALDYIGDSTWYLYLQS